MANDEDDVEVFEDVEWLVDDDGTEYFVKDGQRWELGDDGYAYTVAPAADTDPGTEPSDIEEPASAEEAADAEEAMVTEEVPVVTITQEPDPGAAPVEDDGVLLSLEAVRSGYGNLPVLHDVTMAIRQGQTAVMLGLNGAGKTTTALNISGAVKSWSGHIRFGGQDITSLPVRRRVREGIVLVPEGRRVFPDLSVARNLQIGAWMQRKDADWMKEQRERVLEYFPRLRERLAQLAGTLSGGEQQMLAIARGLMARPRLLIIDEASMGLAPVIVHDVFEIVRQINQDGVTVLMIEQNVGALEVADVGIVMEQGHVVHELAGSDLTDRSVVTELLMG